MQSEKEPKPFEGAYKKVAICKHKKSGDNSQCVMFMCIEVY